MAPYFFLLVALLFLSVWEVQSLARNSLPLWLALTITIAFVGLRFETGADWMEYETLLSATPAIFENRPTFYNPNLIVEPGFQFVIAFLNSLGLGIQFLLFLCAAFSILALAHLSWIYSRYPTMVILWYCGFALLLGQMAAIRQVTAYGFLCLGFVAYDRGANYRSLAFVALAASMHVFSLVLAPIIYLRARPPATSIVLLVCLGGFLLSSQGFNAFGLLALPISLVFGGLVETKIEMYNSVGSFAISASSLVLIAWHAIALVLLTRRPNETKELSIVRCATYGAIWSLVAHTYFALMPAVWNRTMLLTMPLEIVGLLVCYKGWLRDATYRLLVPLAVFLASTTSIAYALAQESALPYVPYRSVVQVWATGEVGDGRLRYQLEQARLDRRLEEQRQF